MTNSERLIDKLSEEEVDELLFEKYPFETESCGDCSHLRWGSYDKNSKIEEDGENGEIPCCSNGKEIWEMSTAPEASRLTAEDALKYLEHNICGRYDGVIPFTEEEVEKWIKDREQLIKEIGFEPGEYFKDNEKLSELVATNKLEFGNKEHIDALRGYKKLMAELICPYKLSEKLKKVNPGINDDAFPDSPYSLALKKYKELNKKNDWKAINALSEGIAKYLTNLKMWTMEEFGLGQSVLYHIVRNKELKRWRRAIWESFGNPDKKVVWYQDMHRFIYKDKERKDLVKGLCNCLAGVSYSISEG